MKDLVFEQLLKMKHGRATIMFGLVVMRTGERFLVGETINIRDRGVDAEAAAAEIRAITRNRD